MFKPQQQYRRREPFACSPSSLPKLPPSKEYDVRLRQEEARRYAHCANFAKNLVRCGVQTHLLPSCSCRQRNSALGGRAAESVRPGNENRVTHRAELKQQTHVSAKSNSENLNPEDSVPGFRTTVQLNPGYGSTWNNMDGDQPPPSVPGRACSSVRVANACAMRKKGPSRSHIPQFGATDLMRNACEAAAADRHSQPPDSHGCSHKKNPEVRDAAMSHGRKYRRIHHSGPLMPPGGNMEDMLKEHERHIQEAVRKARVSKPGRQH
ncbi:hypothetical protein ABZP36_034126 [Zizania latifolia]